MTFNQVIQTGPDEEGSDDKAVTAMGILNTIDTLLSVVEDHKEVKNKQVNSKRLMLHIFLWAIIKPFHLLLFDHLITSGFKVKIGTIQMLLSYRIHTECFEADIFFLLKSAYDFFENIY